MYIVREIFQLKFGHARAALDLVKLGREKKYLLEPQEGFRVLTDFTGNSYRLIIEGSFNSLHEFEEGLKQELTGTGWKPWYEEFKQHIESSHREILKQVK